MKRQAAYHGEIGANGKAYNKGQFIAEQAEYLAAGTKFKKTAVKKQEIESYVWEVPLDPEMKSIFSYLCSIDYSIKYDRMNLKAMEFNGEDVKKAESLIARYKIGERWHFPNHEVYV